ncbi:MULTISPECIES: PrsW family glutamic-type intramembrane protease [unclassified Mycobacterium]|uniref:PrsW family glutamic-type intramembrane protease n=1 Tax=unclassified Mycobacterium TaxID=2642494 RepID=UPI0029C83363|nr:MULTISPECIES: PrsW family glutamic-type intramembrane protease [unclassified Mycobacterium]
MTVPGAADDWDSLSTMLCRSCGTDVPEGTYCGSCGAAATPTRGGGPAWLRIRAYTAAPNEHVLRPWLTTSLFPRLPRRSRWAFRVALIVLLALLLGFALLRWQPPLIGISALGLPLLFGLYLHETDAFRDQSIVTLTITAILAIGIGVGWALATDAIWKRTYDDVLGTPMSTTDQLINLAAIPIGGTLLMLLPAALMRLLRPGVRESLDGFVIGALAALCFTAAGTLTRAAPEFANGLVAEDFPRNALLALAAIRGIATPLTAAAIGAMVGSTLWFRRRAHPPTVEHWYSLTSPAPALAIAVLLYIAQNRIDYAWISYLQIVGLYAVVAVLAVLALRVALHCTLLREAPDETSPNEPVLCPQCEHVIPELVFCANCGVAAHAASRTSRADRRTHRPTPIDVAPEGR